MLFFLIRIIYGKIEMKIIIKVKKTKEMSRVQDLMHG